MSAMGLPGYHHFTGATFYYGLSARQALAFNRAVCDVDEISHRALRFYWLWSLARKPNTEIAMAGNKVRVVTGGAVGFDCRS